jgi:hypothetical protein
MFSKRTTILAAALGAGAIAAPAASAAPTVTNATGANTAAIQAAVDAYRNSLGTNNAANPAQQSGRREINWDGVPDDRAAPSFMPEGQFRGRGALFTTPGLGVQVSGDDNDDNGSPDADPDQVEFANLNPNYPNSFATFSAERLFAPVGSNVTDVEFVVPGTDTPAVSNGLGVVFTDVDQANTTKIELLDAQGESLGVFPVAASPGSETLSFLGIKLDPGVAAAAARITTGSAAMVTPPPSPEDGAADIVAMDDFIYGEPLAAGADKKAPNVTVKGAAKRIDLRSLVRGLKLQVTTDERASVTARLTADARRVEFARKAKVLLAEKSLGNDTGTRQLKLKPKASALRGAGKLTVKLQLVATDVAGNTSTLTKKIKVG